MSTARGPGLVTLAGGPGAAGVLAAGGAAALAAALRVWPPGTLPGVVCPVAALSGLDCPGCGATRALAALGHGDPVAAVDHNALVVTLLVALAAWWVAWLVAHRAGRERPSWVPPARTVAVVLVVWTAARNLPVPVLDVFASAA